MIAWLLYEWDFDMWTIVAVIAAAVAAISIWADWRRQRRKRIGEVSFIPWTAISMLAIGTTLIAAAFAVKSG